MKKITLALMLTICFLNLKSQDFTKGPELPDVQFASPNAAAFTKYLGTPVSYYSGVPNISIPIYNLNINGFNIPISLDYHAGGIKVQESESWVGLGWNLNVGGIITRTVKGKPDDYAGGIGNNKTVFLESNKDILQTMNLNGASGTAMLTDIERESLFLGSYSRNGLILSKTNLYDGTFDEFNFNFLGYSGKFVYNESVNQFISNNDKVNVQTTSKGFLLIDDNGNKYYFENVENSPLSSLSANGIPHAVSYHLSKINLYNSDKTIEFVFDWKLLNNMEFNGGNFNYLMEGFYYLNVIGGSQYVGTFFHGYPFHPAHNAVNHMLANELAYTLPVTSPSMVDNDFGFLKEIKVDNTIVKFNTTVETLSCIGVSNRELVKLNSIEVSQNGKIVHTTNFNYDYFTPDDGFKKVKLSDITVNNKKFDFEYIESSGGKNIPSLHTKGIDYWGYYNGQDQNSNLNTNIKSSLKPPVKRYVPPVSSAVRTANENYAKLGSLKKIIYPTGGYTIYEYESNTYSSLYYKSKHIESGATTTHSLSNDKLDLLDYNNVSGSNRIGGGLRIKSIKKYDKDNVKVLHKNYTYHDGTGISYGVLETPFANCKARLTVDERAINDGIWAGRAYSWLLYLDVFNNSLIPYSGKTKCSIGYKCVIESDELSNGKTQYYYTTSEDYPDTYNSNTYYTYNNGIYTNTGYQLTLNTLTNNSDKRGLLKKTEVYDKNDVLIKKEELSYTFRNSTSGNINRAIFPPDMEDLSMKTVITQYTPYYTLLSSKITTDYYGSNNVITTINYTYNTEYPYVASESLTVNGKNHKKEYLYVNDNPSLSGKEADNAIAEPYKIINKVGTTENYSMEKSYTLKNGAYVPTTITEDINATQAHQTTVDYDSYNNIKKISRKDGMFEYYIWAYDGMYPVVKIISGENFSLNVTISDASLSKTDAMQDVKTAVNYLKTQLSSYLNDDRYQVFLYTYEPLVGMTSESNQNQITTYYEYDEFGRLIRIRDFQGNVLKENKYNYAQ